MNNNDARIRTLLLFNLATGIVVELTLLVLWRFFTAALFFLGIIIYVGSILIAAQHGKKSGEKMAQEEKGQTEVQSVGGTRKPVYPDFARRNRNLSQVALLIDADNILPEMINHIMRNIGLINDSEIVFSCLYGNAPALKNWKGIAERYGMEQQFSDHFIPGKNSTDFRIVMDAMDLVRDNPQIDTFVLCSSDSDFTAIARRLRSENKTVIGMGENTAPSIFRESCSRFIDLSECMWRDTLTNLISRLVNKNGGSVSSASVSSEVRKMGYSYQDLGFSTFGQLVKDLGFELNGGKVTAPEILRAPSVQVSVT